MTYLCIARGSVLRGRKVELLTRPRSPSIKAGPNNVLVRCGDVIATVPWRTLRTLKEDAT